MISESRNKIAEEPDNTEFLSNNQGGLQDCFECETPSPQDIELYAEIEESLCEKDIIQLRNQLKNIQKSAGASDNKNILTESDTFFGLSEEIKGAVNLNVNEDEPVLGTYLQKLHLQNHVISSKEIVHELFSQNTDQSEHENLELSPDDEMLFSDIKCALIERDILDLRSNLQAMSRNVSIHEYSFEDIEEFLEGDLDLNIADSLLSESLVNSSLSDEIELHRNVEVAAQELDIIHLRSQLSNG